ncbi:hypothetical protein D3C73_1616530 [compost metagenome]
MTEVETQALAIHQRAFLLHVIAQHLAQCSMQQVSRRVVQGGGVLNIGIDLGLNLGADHQRTTGHDAVMQ